MQLDAFVLSGLICALLRGGLTQLTDENLMHLLSDS